MYPHQYLQISVILFNDNERLMKALLCASVKVLLINIFSPPTTSWGKNLYFRVGARAQRGRDPPAAALRGPRQAGAEARVPPPAPPPAGPPPPACSAGSPALVPMAPASGGGGRGLHGGGGGGRGSVRCPRSKGLAGMRTRTWVEEGLPRGKEPSEGRAMRPRVRQGPRTSRRILAALPGNDGL